MSLADMNIDKGQKEPTNIKQDQFKRTKNQCEIIQGATKLTQTSCELILVKWDIQVTIYRCAQGYRSIKDNFASKSF